MMFVLRGVAMALAGLIAGFLLMAMLVRAWEIVLAYL